MKKRLTEVQFQEAIRGLALHAQTVEIVRGVLVEGKPQVALIAPGRSRSAVSQAVNRVWAAHAAKSLPRGFERVSVVLPEHQAFIVKKWAEDATKRIERVK